MRFGAVFRYRQSYGAVRCCDMPYGAVPCGFEKLEILRCGSVRFSEVINLTARFPEIRNPTVRFSDTVNPTVRFVAVFTNQKSYGAIRHRSPFNGFSTVRFQQQHRFLSTVHRMNKPYKIAVSYGSHAFSRGSNETDVPLLFLYGAPYC